MKKRSQCIVCDKLTANRWKPFGIVKVWVFACTKHDPASVQIAYMFWDEIDWTLGAKLV